jgi:hypothetical protein
MVSETTREGVTAGIDLGFGTGMGPKHASGDECLPGSDLWAGEFVESEGRGRDERVELSFAENILRRGGVANITNWALSKVNVV